MFKELIKKEFLPEVDISAPFIIMGDFNFEESEKSLFQKTVCNMFACSQICTLPTTDYGSCIDLVFTNLTGVITTFLECPWSDHKAVLIGI